jgi:hypothetical protein
MASTRVFPSVSAFRCPTLPCLLGYTCGFSVENYGISLCRLWDLGCLYRMGNVSELIWRPQRQKGEPLLDSQ